MRTIKVLVTLAVVWSLYWFGAGYALRIGIAGWFDGRAAQGWQAEFSDIQTKGFPLRHITTMDSPALADPVSGAAWHGDWMSFDSPAYWPGQQVLRFADTPHYLSYFDQTIVVQAKDLMAELYLKTGLALEIERLTLTAGPWEIDGDKGQLLAAQSLELAMVQQERPETYKFDVNATRFTLGTDIRVMLQSSESLPSEFQALELDMKVTFDRVWNRMSLEQQRPQPRQIDLKLAEFQWGELRLFATGDLAVDGFGIPSGVVAIKAENWRGMLQMAQASGAFPRQILDPAEDVLGLLAGLGGDPNSLDIKLTFKNGSVAIGPLPIGPAPRIILR
ncbi:MAG: DUF2125 domain-containing protein [Rhodobacteraceae bacterium]|nr:DUF2125 domain-containing protein [Paracoccaceae bacterium]